MNSKNIRWINLLVLIIGLSVAARFSFNIWKIWKSGDKVKDAEAQLVQAKKEQQELQNQLATVQTDEFIEKEARDKLGYGREGEVIFVLPPPEITDSQKTASDVPNWKLWWNLYIRI